MTYLKSLIGKVKIHTILQAPKYYKNVMKDSKRFWSENWNDKMIVPHLTTAKRRSVGIWLIGCAGAVYGAVAIGGLTRLTESGLSMVNWDLFRSMLPPTSAAEWEFEYERYKKYPEYEYKSKFEPMTMSEFKFIWSMEYLHRMWGRGVGLMVLLPMAGFWMRGCFTPAMKRRMLIAAALVCAQGGIGWWMVKSGLHQQENMIIINREDAGWKDVIQPGVPRVSQYRLAIHLGTAFVLYTMFVWTGLTYLIKPHDHSRIAGITKLRGLTHGSKTLMFITAIMGAFVAGLDAGLVYNSWPKFADKWIPENLLSRTPLWKNFTENDVTVQFIHRNLAYMTWLSFMVTWVVGARMRLSPRAKMALHTTMLMANVQVVLGITTLVHYVPTWMASLHQNGAMLLMTAVMWLAHEIRRFPK